MSGWMLSAVGKCYTTVFWFLGSLFILFMVIFFLFDFFLECEVGGLNGCCSFDDGGWDGDGFSPFVWICEMGTYLVDLLCLRVDDGDDDGGWVYFPGFEG